MNIVGTFFRPFMSGVLAILPILLTFSVVAWVADFLTRIAGPGSKLGQLFKQFGWSIGSSDSGAYIGGLLTAILVVYLLGLLLEHALKRKGESIIDSIFLSIPLISSLYKTAKKVVGMVEPKKGAELESMTAVLCRFGDNSDSCFPAFMPTSETIVIDQAEYRVVMIPTAPVPFGGAILCVRKEWVTKLDCGVEGLLNMYLSMGTAMPDYIKTPE